MRCDTIPNGPRAWHRARAQATAAAAAAGGGLNLAAQLAQVAAPSRPPAPERWRESNEWQRRVDPGPLERARERERTSAASFVEASAQRRLARHEKAVKLRSERPGTAEPETGAGTADTPGQRLGLALDLRRFWSAQRCESLLTDQRRPVPRPLQVRSRRSSAAAPR